jgi:hypothetical protein
MNADAELDATLGRQSGIALDDAILHLDRAAHGVDDAPKLDQSSVAGALDHATMMHGDGGIDQIAAQRPQPRQNTILVRAGEPAVADYIRDQDRRNFPGLAHRAPSAAIQISTKTCQSRPLFDIERFIRKKAVPSPWPRVAFGSILLKNSKIEPPRKSGSRAHHVN